MQMLRHCQTFRRFLHLRNLQELFGLTEENGPEKEEGNRQEAPMW